MENLAILRERVDALLKRYAAVGQERDAIKKELAALKERYAELDAQLQQAESHLLAVQIGKVMPDEQSRAQSRRKLDAVIGEIDKILTTLND